MAVQLDQYYVPNEGIVSRVTNDEMVLVDLGEGIYHGLNPVGAEVWQRLDGERTLQQVVNEIGTIYPEAAPDVVQADVIALMQALLDNELVSASR